MGKGEIACYKQFLLFPHCFQKDLSCRHPKNQGLFGKGLKGRKKMWNIMVKILVTSKYSFSYSVIKWLLLNFLTDDKTLDQSNLKAFAVNKINGCQKSNLVLGRTENIVGKEENAGYQHFLLFPRYFQTAFFLKVVKSRNCVVKGCLAWGFCSKWLTLSQTILTFNNPYINNFWKLFGKENAGNKHFFLFPNYFSSPITWNHHLSDTCP